jgi:tripartite-type tricarboxylate transporter receptor subunit TctC
MLDRRQFSGALASVAATAVTAPLLAQAKYPTRPITLVVGYAAGGGTDTVARVFAAKLEAILKGQIVVENRAGAAGNLATDAVAGAAPDGYTLLIGNQGPMVVNPHLFKKMRSDPAKTLEPIALIADAALVLVVGPGLPAKTLKEFVDEAKRRPGELNYGSASHASASHLAAALLAHVSGIKARHVAYRGAGPALNDLVGGHLHFMVTTVPSATGLIEGKTLTALAVTSETRAATLPDVPTALEAGLPGYTASAWYGLLAPKGLPADVRQTLEAATAQALKDPEVIARLKDDGAVPAEMASAKFGEFMASERARWGEIVKAANITIE